MSLFKTVELACPACRTKLAFQAVNSVNADRRPDLREAILAGIFQRRDCPHCGVRFRLDPDFNYLDVARGQWIIAAPVAGLVDWKVGEAAARDMFASAYGEQAADAAREIGRHLRPRITFGWTALREKLLCGAHALDDVALEGCKAIAMRGVQGLPVSAEADLRLADVDGDRLILAWLRSFDGAEGDAVALPRETCEQIASDPEWAAFRSGFDGVLFVDLGRTLVRQPAAA